MASASVIITQLINLSIKQCVFSLCSGVFKDFRNGLGFSNNYTVNQSIYQTMCIFPLFWCHFKDFRNGPGFSNNYTVNQPIYQAICIFPLFWCHFKDFRNGPASVIITQLIELSIKQCVFSLCSGVILRTLEMARLQ